MNQDTEMNNNNVFKLFGHEIASLWNVITKRAVVDGLSSRSVLALRHSLNYCLNTNK